MFVGARRGVNGRMDWPREATLLRRRRGGVVHSGVIRSFIKERPRTQ